MRVRPPALHWPSIRGRARADALPLLLSAAVVAIVTLLTGVVPPLLDATAAVAVRDAVRRAGDDADVRVQAGWEYDDGPLGGRVRAPHLAEDVRDFRNRASNDLGPGLRAALRPPIATVSSPVLKITDGSVLRTLQLTYLAGAAPGTPRVTWVAGAPPPPAVPAADDDLEVLDSSTPWPVWIGLSEADADALRARPGARIPVADDRGNVKNVRVSGIFRAADEADPGWRLAPGLLRPRAGADGVGSTRLGGLLSAESLPDARLAFDQEQLRRTVWFTPDPDALTGDSAAGLSAALVAGKASSGSSGGRDSALRWETQLDGVLRDVQSQVGAASGQASVLLIGVLVTAVLTLLLAADLLVRRRAGVLIAARQRGAGLPGLGAELLLEAAAVALTAGAAGFALAAAITPGASWRWALPVVLAGPAAGPILGTITAARATRARRAPANRSARRLVRRTGQLRRATVEAAVLLAAAGALVTLRQGGLLPGAAAGAGPGGDGGTALPASAPTLGVLAGALLLLRLLPAGNRLVLRRALRSHRPLAVFGAARAAATSARALPLLVLVTSTALASFTLTLHSTGAAGLADGAWRTVGADARLDLGTDDAASTPAIAARVAAAPGVRQVVTAQVTDNSRIATDAALTPARLVIVDAAAYRRLLADTPLPGQPALGRLAARPNGDLPALVRSRDGSLRPGMRLRLLRENAPAVHLVAIGTAPGAGDAQDVVLVDAAGAAAAGLPAAPNTMWATGPGAERAVAAHTVVAHAALRSEVLRARRDAPLSAALLRLAWACAAVLLALGLLGFALAAAAAAPERWQTLSRLRTLGLRPRDARWVAVGELLPPVAVAAVGGPLLGVLLAGLTLGPLELRLLTGQAADPPPVPPWWALALLAAVLLAAVPAQVHQESARRRRQRLGDVLRAGEPVRNPS